MTSICHSQIQFAGCTIRPILEALAAQMDAPMVLLMPVPIPERSGDVELVTYVLWLHTCLYSYWLTAMAYSVHVPKPGALATNTWYSHDAAGYQASEKSMLEWGRTQFSEYQSKYRKRETLTKWTFFTATEERARRNLAANSGASSGTVANGTVATTDPIQLSSSHTNTNSSSFNTPLDNDFLPLDRGPLQFDDDLPATGEPLLPDRPDVDVMPLFTTTSSSSSPNPIVSVVQPSTEPQLTSIVPTTVSPPLPVPGTPLGRSLDGLAGDHTGEGFDPARQPPPSATTPSSRRQGLLASSLSDAFATPPRGDNIRLPPAFPTLDRSSTRNAPPMAATNLFQTPSGTTIPRELHSPPKTPNLGFINLPEHIQSLHDYFLTNPETNKPRAWHAQWIIAIREYISFEKRSGFPVRTFRSHTSNIRIRTNCSNLD